MKQYDFISDIDENGKENISVAFAHQRKKIEIVPMVICFFIALLIWIYMVNLNDTGVTSTMTIPITVEGADEIRAKSNMLMYGMDRTEVVVTVKGSNRDLKKYSQGDYRAVIDISEINKVGKHNLPVKIITPEGTNTITVASTEPAMVSLYTDVSMTAQVPFDYLQGNWVTNPTYTYTIEKNADFIEITGPKTIIDSIKSAKFRIPDEEYNSSKSFSGFQLSFVDKNGDYVSYDSSVVAYNTLNVYVRVIVTAQKTIPVTVKLPEGVRGVVAVPSIEQVTVKGDPTILNAINEYKVSVTKNEVEYGAYLLISGDNLPEGVTVVEQDSILTIVFRHKTEEASEAEDAE